MSFIFTVDNLKTKRDNELQGFILLYQTIYMDIFQLYLKEKECTIQYNLLELLQFDFHDWIRTELQSIDNPTVKNLLSSVPLKESKGIRDLKNRLLDLRPFLSNGLYEEIKAEVKQISSDFRWAHSKEGKLVILIEKWIGSARAKVAAEFPNAFIYIGRSFVSPVSLVIGGYVEADRLEDIKTYCENLMPPIPVQYKVLPLHTVHLP